MAVINICQGFRGFAVPPLPRGNGSIGVDDSVAIDFVVPEPLPDGQEVSISVSVTDFALREFTGVPRLLYQRDLPDGARECRYRLEASARPMWH